MNIPSPEQPAGLETRAFVLLLVIVTLAFGVILLPFWGAVFWGVSSRFRPHRCSGCWCAGWGSAEPGLRSPPWRSSC
jgi:hypothetical protein